MKKLTIFFILASLMIFNCGERIISNFNSELDNIEQKFTPDKSIAVFDAKLNKNQSGWLIKGETTSLQAKEAILLSTKSILGNSGFQDSVIVLPHPDLGADTVAIVNVSVANLRRKPSVGEELVDQVIMGDKLRVLKKE